MTVLVASTVAEYKADQREYVEAWLTHANAWARQGHRFFLAVQGHGHARRLARLCALVQDGLGGTVWRFAVDEGTDRVGNAQRLAGICVGRNLAHEYAQRDPAFEAILFLDTDTEPPPDAIDRLLEVDNGLVGFHVPTYGLDGPKVSCQREPVGWSSWAYLAVGGRRHAARPFPEGADVREHQVQTAGALLVRRPVLRALRWRWDLEAGMTDDPCFEQDAQRYLGVPTWVRHDVVGRHHPQAIGPYDQRGHDLSIVRS